MRGLKKVRDHVLSIPGRYQDVEDNFKVKETILEGIRLVKQLYKNSP
ncbi:MAG: hypothetical protein ACE5K3_02485 [bacterium]